MKAKKILFILAGIFNCVIGGLGVLFGGLILILNRILRMTFESSYEFVEEYIAELVKQDSQYEYLLSASKSETIDFIIHSVNTVAVVFFIIGVVIILFGVINLLLSSPKYYNRFKQKKVYKVLFLICSWVVMFFNIANILTTIAVCIKDKTDTPPLYTSNQGEDHA